MFKSILLAVDVNDGNIIEKAARVAVRLSRDEGAELHIVNVVPDSGMAIVGMYLGARQAEEIRIVAHKALESWVEKNIPADLPAQLHVAQGVIYDEIIKTANALGAEAIVMGSHSPQLRDYLIGPNATRVVRHATQSVFIVR